MPTTFFSLPRELRDMIYPYVLFSNEKSHQHTWIDTRRFRNGIPNCLTYHAPSLLATCRLIRCEASPMYYHKIQFRFSEAETAIRWLSNLDDENRHDIKNLAYCPNFWNWMDPRQPPVHLGKQWMELRAFFEMAAMDARAVLKICGYEGGKLGWVVAEGGFEYGYGEEMAVDV